MEKPFVLPRDLGGDCMGLQIMKQDLSSHVNSSSLERGVYVANFPFHNPEDSCIPSSCFVGEPLALPRDLDEECICLQILK